MTTKDSRKIMREEGYRAYLRQCTEHDPTLYTYSLKDISILQKTCYNVIRQLFLIKKKRCVFMSSNKHKIPSLPLFTGKQGRNHLQGIAVDEKNRYIYYSFTTRLIKSDLQGNLLGSVEGLVGHLGCIAFCEADGKVYGSLEFKKDAIGAGILRTLDDGGSYADGFYIAVFDVDKITRDNMSAEADGVMTAAFLPEVLADYEGTGRDNAGNTVPHRYGCSGIDGLCFAPKPGQDGDRLLWVAYGVYSDTKRDDNDHQVLLCYPREEILRTAAPLRQRDMHSSGPAAPAEKYFALTGNTTYGVQNLEYDEARRLLLMAVYPGSKTEYQNRGLFAADLSEPAVTTRLKGLDEQGKALTMWGSDAPESARRAGWDSPYGQYGIHRLFDGGYLVAEPTTLDGEQAAYIRRYTFDTENGLIKA